MARLFVVDDDPLVRAELSAIAQELGMACEGFALGRAARARFAQVVPEIVVVDGLLPDMNGFDLVAQAARLEPKPVIVFLSAFFADLRSFQRLRALGATKVLHKPLGRAALADELRALVPTVTRLASDAAPSPASSAAAALGVEMAALQRRYLERLPAMADELDALADAWRRGEPAAAALGPLIHSLAGLAASLGQAELSLRAHGLQALLTTGADARVSGADLAELSWRLRKAAALSASASTGVVAHAEAPPAWLRQVVLVGKDPFLGRAAQGPLERAGVRLRLASDAAGAVDAVARSAPDALVLDHSIGDADGRLPAALRRVAQALPAGTPLLVLDPDTSPLHALVEPPPGAAGVTRVQKPLTGSELLAALRVAETSAYRGARVAVLGAEPAAVATITAVLGSLGIEVEPATTPAPGRAARAVSLLLVAGPEPARPGLIAPWQKDRPSPLPVLELGGQSDGSGPEPRLSASPSAGELLFQVTRALKDSFLRRAWSFALRAHALRDPLTGLMARELLVEHLDTACERVGEAGAGAAGPGLLLVEVAGFGSANAQHGALTADRALREAAESLELGLGWGDFAARDAGARFMVVIQSGTDVRFDQIVDAARARLAARPLFGPRGEWRVQLVASATWIGATDTARAALERAHDALTQACDRGEARVRVTG